MSLTPYFDDGAVTLYHGDCRELLAVLDLDHVGVVVADPPYGETSLGWDRWPGGWVGSVAKATRRSCSLWCFGSLRMFLRHGAEFETVGWQLAQDVVWRKHTGSGFAADRFKRVHEHVVQWYRGPWGEVHKSVPRVARTGPHKGAVRPVEKSAHLGDITRQPWVDDGTRLMQSVIDAMSLRGRAIHPTQKPLGIIDPLLRFSLAPGGCVLDPFAGSCSTLVAAREAGYRAIGIEADPAMCEKAAQRLSLEQRTIWSAP